MRANAITGFRVLMANARIPAPVIEPIRPLAGFGSGDVAFAGGKATNLGQLTATGFPVPTRASRRAW